MASSITRFDIKRFDGKNDFGLWQIKMRALMVQQGCDVSLETLPADMEHKRKDRFDEEGIQYLDSILGRLCFTGSYQENNYCRNLDEALMLLTSLPSSYKNFMETLLCGRESLTTEDVLATLNSKELKKRTKGTKGSSKEILSNKEVKWVRQEGDSVQLGDNRTCIIKGTGNVKIQLYDGSSFILEDVKYVLELRRSLISLGTLEKEGYTMKMQMVLIREIKGYRSSKQVRLKQLGSKQVGLKQLGHKKVGFKQLGHGVKKGVHEVQVEKHVWFEVELHGAQGDREAEIFQVSNDDVAVAQSWLEDKQLEEKTNTDCLVKEQEKVYLGIEVGENIMVTRVPGQEDAEGNVTEKKKVKESMKANLGKLLKYNA
ncbi:hypothetical protein Tco_0867746 [Tanacetum coccineum]